VLVSHTTLAILTDTALDLLMAAQKAKYELLAKQTTPATPAALPTSSQRTPGAPVAGACEHRVSHSTPSMEVPTARAPQAAHQFDKSEQHALAASTHQHDAKDPVAVTPAAFSYTRATSRTVVDPRLAFATGEIVACATCRRSMKAPGPGHGLRCANCREIIYPCPLPTQSPVSASLDHTTNLDHTQPVQLNVPKADPDTVRTASQHANDKNWLLVLFQREELCHLLLCPDIVGLRTLCRLRRVCQTARKFADTVLQTMSPIVLLGGTQKKYSGLNLNTVKSLDLGTMSFLQQTPMPTERSGHCACILSDGKRVVVAGGSEHSWEQVDSNAKSQSNPVANDNSFDKENKPGLLSESASAAVCSNGQWSALSSMKQPRYGARACALADGRVLVAGGSCGECYLNSVELLDPETGKWTSLPSMGAMYCQFAMGQLQDGRIVVAGGCTSGQPGTNFRKAEAFDLGTRKWSWLPDMQMQRAYCAGCVDSRGKLIVCGGEDGNGPTNSCEYYDPEINSWVVMPPMNTARAGHTVCRAGIDLLVAGGRPKGSRNHLKTVNSFELWDSSSARWIMRAVDPQQQLIKSDLVAVSCGPFANKRRTKVTVARKVPDTKTDEPEPRRSSRKRVKKTFGDS